jgi:hypothetical protein
MNIDSAHGRHLTQEELDEQIKNRLRYNIRKTTNDSERAVCFRLAKAHATKLKHRITLPTINSLKDKP